MSKKLEGDKCPKCRSYGEARDSDFGEFNGSRRFRCQNTKCLCEWETVYTVEAVNQIIDE